MPTLLDPIKIGDLELGLLEWDAAPDWKIAESRRIECELSPLRSDAKFDEGSGEG